MFEPAISTRWSRTDLMYGLGWYSQRYETTRLLWHSGRWPPSASALYLKVPDQNLTFIILANTTYLTTPFPLGQGDVLYSTLAETFYRTFIFPQQYGKTVPQVDWEADEGDLVHQLKGVTDEDLREMLERELWSFRQLFASVGRKELVTRLREVHQQVFGASLASGLDLHVVQGVEYHPVVHSQVELSEAEMERCAGRYVLSEAPQVAGAELPPEVTIEVRRGKLIGVDANQGCVSLVPITTSRFAIPENPVLTLEFHMHRDGVERVTVEVGGLVVVYKPGGE
jgi:hypothetical protein